MTHAALIRTLMVCVLACAENAISARSRHRSDETSMKTPLSPAVDNLDPVKFHVQGAVDFKKLNLDTEVWKDHTNSCARQQTSQDSNDAGLLKVPRTKEWRSKTGDYQGLSLQFECLPTFETVSVGSGPCSLGYNNGKITRGDPERCKQLWKNQMSEKVKKASIELELTAPAPFSASELVLESTQQGVLCRGTVNYLSIELSYQTGTGSDSSFEQYINDAGDHTFACKSTDLTCRIPLQPAFDSSRIRVKFSCLGVSTSKAVPLMESSKRNLESLRGYAKMWQKTWNNDLDIFGFANPVKMGKSVMLNIGFQTQMSTFTFTPVVKYELSKLLSSAAPLINCTSILSSCIIDAQFTKWKINEYGKFTQSPRVKAPPIRFQIQNEMWNLTVSKKRLVTAGESAIEKRMVCVTRPKMSKECCVAKKLLELFSHTQVEEAQARLENF